MKRPKPKAGPPRYPEFAERITALRLALGFNNAAAFARMVGWSTQQLNNYESGIRLPNREEAEKLRVKVGVPLDFIYHGTIFAGVPADILEKLNALQPPAKKRA